MKETIRRERQAKLLVILQMTEKHLEDALCTLNDANLYSNEDQEHQIDTLVTHIGDIMKDLQTEVPLC